MIIGYSEDVQLIENKKRLAVSSADKVLERAQQLIIAGQEDSFVVVDLSVVRSQVARWRANLPKVAPWYAIKCHPDVELMKELFRNGCGFDAASIVEMQSAISLGCSPDNIIFANPCKQPSHIRFAFEHGIRLMTFDNIEELRKIKKYHPSARLVMRILGDDSSSLCKFNAKFGIGVEDSIPLLREAKRIKFEIVGVPFRLGLGAERPTPLWVLDKLDIPFHALRHAKSSALSLFSRRLDTVFGHSTT
jgi:diaminopimelate decarboxylase